MRANIIHNAQVSPKNCSTSGCCPLRGVLATSDIQREKCKLPLQLPGHVTCNGYLDHPFKKKNPSRLRMITSPLVANTEWLVYNPKSSTASSCSKNDTLT